MPKLERYVIDITTKLVVQTSGGLDGAIKHAVRKASVGFSDMDSPLGNESHVVECEVTDIRAGKRHE